MSEPQSVPTHRKRGESSRPKFAPGDRVETYIGKVRVTGTVESYEPGGRLRSPRVVEEGKPGTPFEGWVRVTHTHPGKITLVTDKWGQPVTRTDENVWKIKKGQDPREKAAKEG